MILLTVDEIIKLHSLLCAKTGGADGLRDRGLLESAVYSAEMTFGDAEIYPTLTEKCARLCYALTSNHPFADGNKRIGVLAMLTFLYINGRPLSTSNEEVVRMGLSVAAGEMDYAALLSWIKQQE